MCKNWFLELSHAHCKKCQIQYDKLYRLSSKGFFVGMCKSMNANAKLRKGKGRIEAGVVNIDSNFLVALFKEQQGLCYYSGLPLSCTSFTNWLCSPERLDNNKGYIIGNVKLICLEFNSPHRQWSKDKTLQVAQLQKKDISFDELTNDVENARLLYKVKTYTTREAPIKKKGIVLYNCTCCNGYFDKSLFYPIKINPFINANCISCCKNKSDVARNTMRGFIIHALGSARDHCKNIKKNVKRSEENSKYELTLEIILNKIIQQKGRCYYSNIPLTFKPKTDWSLSIERLDNKKGYTDKNTVLICLEFNSMDQSSITETETGSGQWSKEKFSYFMKNFKQ